MLELEGVNNQYLQVEVEVQVEIMTNRRTDNY